MHPQTEPKKLEPDVDIFCFFWARLFSVRQSQSKVGALSTLILPGSATLCDPTAAHPRIFPPFACERPCTDCCALAIAIKDIIDRPIGRPSLARVNYLLRSDHPPLTITLSSPGLAIPSHKTAPHSRAAAPTPVPALLPPHPHSAQGAKTTPPRREQQRRRPRVLSFPNGILRNHHHDRLP